MRKVVVSILLVSLLLGCLCGEALAATVEFTGDSNVRSNPSINATSLGVVSSGSYLEYLYEDSTDNRGVIWYKVRYGNMTGWVSSKYSFVSGGYEYIYGEVYVYDDSFVRQSPSLNGTKLGAAHGGDTLYFLGDVSTDERGVDWYRVVFGNSSGWISSRYTILTEDDD